MKSPGYSIRDWTAANIPEADETDLKTFVGHSLPIIIFVLMVKRYDFFPVDKNQRVTISYQLFDETGTLIEQAKPEHPLRYLHGYENIVPGLEEALQGKEAGDTLTVNLPPEKAFGPYIEGMLLEVALEELALIPDLKVGMEIEVIQGDQGDNNDSLDSKNMFEESSEYSEPWIEDWKANEPPLPGDPAHDRQEPEEELQIFYVKELHEKFAVLDGNHPLAGKHLRFELKILDVDTPTIEEIEQGFLFENAEE